MKIVEGECVPTGSAGIPAGLSSAKHSFANKCVPKRNLGTRENAKEQPPRMAALPKWTVAMNLKHASTIIVFFLLPLAAHAAVYDAATKTATIADGSGRLQLHLNADGKCLLDGVTVNGRSVVSPETGVCSAVKVGANWHSTRSGIASPEVGVADGVVTVKGIRFGGDGVSVEETWRFTEAPDRIAWRIERKYAGDATLEDSALPGWDFTDMQTWTGALLDTGGVAWCRLMGSPNATYGAHAGSVTFWNKEKNDCLRISATPQANAKAAVRFSHQPNGVFSFSSIITAETVRPKHDLRRFLDNAQDVWKPFPAAGEVSAEYALSAMNYDQAYYRGDLKGLDGGAVREICNTIGRIGVIDAGIMGSNGWYSGYAVLHEHWLAQMGLPIDDPQFFANHAVALDYARDHAIGADGRVKSRWAHAKGDEIPGTYDEYGFYEAQWGMLWDSQPGYVTNVAELFDCTGDVAWVRGQKAACEKVLELALSRDSNHNGLLECMNTSHTEAKGSDWIDVVWAAFDNGFVNAEMYNALLLWADVEEALGDADGASKYRTAAIRIQEAFNKPVAEGGLWSPDKGCYAYWRDQDGSVHGDNFVTPVNLMAVAYGLCSDPARKASILDQLETVMQREKLFFWPLCLTSYQPDEAYKVNWPFPNYENGDLFLAWGEVGIRAYAGYKPEIGVKYLKNVLNQYNRDGLAFQRYLRRSQKGEGGDILANNLQPVTGLYRDIYGIQPKHNRLHLDPHLTMELAGTRLNYLLRGKTYQIALDADHATVSADRFSVTAKGPFSVNVAADAMEYFRGNDKTRTLAVLRPESVPVALRMEAGPDAPKWTVEPTVKEIELTYIVSGLRPEKAYAVLLNGTAADTITVGADGTGMFKRVSSTGEAQMFEIREAAAGKKG